LLMVGAGEIAGVVGRYDPKKVSIATIGSHSALNIFKGAREEGFRTVCVCAKGRDKLYRRFRLADEYIILDKLQDITGEDVQERLKELNSVVIPHGSFNAYLEQKRLREWSVPIFGNRTLLDVETSRVRQHEWMRGAGLKVPKVYKSPSDIKGLAFVKFPGAKGGKGYFVVDNEEAFEKKIRLMVKSKLITAEEAKSPYIQEYIIGVNVYPHYFHSVLSGETEFMGVDKRYESSVDGVYRIPVPEQIGQEVSPSFTIVGNFPMVLRESLLDEIFGIGERIVAESQRLAPPGIIGAFCMETIIRENLEIVAFEISSRIVAGCNALIGQSPYMYLMYDEPMYMGKRMAREIKDAIRLDRLPDIVT